MMDNYKTIFIKFIIFNINEKAKIIRKLAQEVSNRIKENKNQINTNL
jgi:hypothetical protein